MADGHNGRFNKEYFIKAYSDSAYAQANVIAGAFETMDQRFDAMEERFDARFDRIERVLEKAFPEEFAAVNGG